MYASLFLAKVKIMNFDLPHNKFTGVMSVSAVCKGRKKKRKQVIPPGIEPGTLSVLDSRDNHYTMESDMDLLNINSQ